MTDSRPTGPIEEMLDRYAGLIDGVVRRLLQGRLSYAQDDVKQEVAVALWKRLQDAAPIEHPTSYIYIAARREAIRLLKQEAAKYAEVERADDPASPAPGPLSLLERRELGEKIEKAIGRLHPDRARAVRAHLRGLNVREIMAMSGWSYQTARNLIARGLSDLRDALNADLNLRVSK